MKTNGTPFDSGTGSPNGSGDDAEWSALRYLLGEMSADESEAFEQNLATDLQACERVAAAARLTGDLYTALASEIESELETPAAPSVAAKPALVAPPSLSSRSALWAVVGLAAAVCVLVAGGLSLLPRMSDQQQAITDRADASAGSLVAIWTERSAEATVDPPTASAAGADGANADDSRSLADADDAAVDLASDSVLIADDDYDVPGWMIAAVENGNSFSPDRSATEIREN